MGRIVGWTLGTALVLAATVAPVGAQTQWSVGVQIGSVGPARGPVYVPPPAPVYRVPVQRVPVYGAPVYRDAYPVYDPYYRRPAYGERVIVVERHDNGRHNGWYKNRGREWRDDRREWRDDRRDWRDDHRDWDREHR